MLIRQRRYIISEAIIPVKKRQYLNAGPDLTFPYLKQ